MKPIILITGASSGIGRAAAEKFASQNYNLILAARRRERLETLAATLHTRYGTDSEILCFDIQSREQTENAFSQLGDQWKKISVLLNNAGLAAGFDKFQDALLNDLEQMIDTNLKGLIYMTRCVLPLMIASGSGHIINIGSTAGKEVYLKGNVYCATKFAVDALSRAMRIDLLENKIKVTAIHPGMAETEFSLIRFKGDEGKSKQVYKGFQPLSAADIAEVIYFAASRPAHVNLNDIVLTATAQANSYYTHREN